VIVTHPLKHGLGLAGAALYWAADITVLWSALHVFDIDLPVPALVLAYATGYALTRRALPAGGPGAVEGLLPLALASGPCRLPTRDRRRLRLPLLQLLARTYPRCGRRQTPETGRGHAPRRSACGHLNAGGAQGLTNVTRRQARPAAEASTGAPSALRFFGVATGWAESVGIRGRDSWQRQTAGGAVESGQRVLLDRAVVEFNQGGAESLGRAYWDEVQRSTLGLVRIQKRGQALDLCVFGCGPRLLSFGVAAVEVALSRVSCRYSVSGGLLARKLEDEISFTQSAAGQIELRSAIRDFFPSLAARAGEPWWTGALYNVVQSRIHVWISRRYFARSIAEAGS
jgi:hypothetical protein